MYAVLIFLFLLLARAAGAETPAAPPSSLPAIGAPIPITQAAAPSLLINAQELLKADRPSEAANILSSYRPAAGEQATYHLTYARALRRTKSVTDSMEQYRLAVIFEKSNSDKGAVQLERGEAYLEFGYLAEAALCFELSLKEFSDRGAAGRVRLNLAETRYRQGQYTEALQHFEQAGASSRALFGRANTLHALGLYRDANRLYLQLLERDQTFVQSSEETRLAIAENFRMMGALADAKIYYDSITSDAIKPRAALGAGVIALREGDVDGSTKNLSLALASPDRQIQCQARLYLAETDLRANKPDDAFARLQDLRAACPFGRENDAATLLLARLHSNNGRYAESAALLKKLIFRQQPDPEALDALESLLLSARERDQAEFRKLWDEAGQWLLDPSRAATLVTVAWSLRGTGRPFLDVTRWLLKNGPDPVKAEARLLLAEFHADMGDGATALRYLQRVPVKKGDDEHARIRAKVLAAAREYEQAGRALEDVGAASEQDFLLLLDIAGKSRNNSRLAALFRVLVQKIPPSSRAYTRYADYLAGAGKTAEAQRYYEAAVRESEKSGSGGADREIEWARFRLRMLADGAGATAAAPVPPAKQGGGAQDSLASSLADADRKARELSEKTKKVL